MTAVTWQQRGIDELSRIKMSASIVVTEDDLHSDGSPNDDAKTVEMDGLTAHNPSITFTSDSGLNEEVLHSEGDVPSTEGCHYFSTPVQRDNKRRPSAFSDLQENPFGYKSFFNLECEEIIQQLQSKAAQGWSANKRKLEELDISTIEAEPLPSLCFTLESILDETTCSAKRRRIDYHDVEENASLDSHLTKQKSPGCGTFRVKGSEKLLGLNQCRGGDSNSIQEKYNPSLNSENHAKYNMFLKCSTTRLQSNLPANQSPMYLRIHNNIDIQNASFPALEFRSFFATECENICNQLKRNDKKRFGNVSSIEAELPPVLSASSNSTIVLEQDSTNKEISTMGISQLDFEKMNINYSMTERTPSLQKPLSTMLCNGNGTEPEEKVMVINTAQDSHEIVTIVKTKNIKNEEPGDGAVQEQQMTQCLFPAADTALKSDGVAGANTTQDIKLHEDISPSGLCIVQKLVKVHNKLSLANSTQDISVYDDIGIVNGTQVIKADKVTPCSKMALPENPISTKCSHDSIANATQDMENVSALETMQNIRTICRRIPADVTQEIMTSENLSVLDRTVDFGTRKSPEINSMANDTQLLDTCHEMSPKINLVTGNPLQNETVIKSNANTFNTVQNTKTVPSKMFPDIAMNNTFTHCMETETNVTHDIISANRGTVKNCIQNLTHLISYKDASNTHTDTTKLDEKPQMNATQTLISSCNGITINDSLEDRGDLTKVIATNCAMFNDQCKNVCDQSEKQRMHKCPMEALAHSSPRREPMDNVKDTTYNLDLTAIPHDDSVFCNRIVPFITSTPLPNLGNHVFIKKTSGLPIKPKPSVYSDQQGNIYKGISAQREGMPQRTVTGQLLGGGPQTRIGISQGLQLPNFCKSATPKVMESRMPPPSSRCSLALSVFKTPQTKAAVLRKDLVPSGRTIMKPPLAPMSLPRKSMQYGQPCKSGTSSNVLQTQTPVNCIKTAGKDIFKKRTDLSKLHPSSLVMAPLGLSTPGYAGKVQSIPAPLTVARVCKVSPSIPAPGCDPPGTMHQEHTFIRPVNLVGSQIPSRLKPRISGLPVRKSQETFLMP